MSQKSKGGSIYSITKHINVFENPRNKAKQLTFIQLEFAGSSRALTSTVSSTNGDPEPTICNTGIFTSGPFSPSRENCSGVRLIIKNILKP